MAIAWSPVLSALFFMVSTILRSIIYVGHITRSHYDADDQQQLDPAYIQLEWEWRGKQDAIYSAANVLTAIAWVLFCIPMIQVAWVLSRGGVRKVGIHGAIVGFSFAGVLTELLARFLTFGSKTSSIWLSKTFNLNTWIPGSVSDGERDDVGWRALEVNYRVIHGLISYVDAFEWVCLFCVLCLIAHSVSTMQNQILSIWWARFGLLVAFLCLFDLASAVVWLFDPNDYMAFAVGIGLVNMVFFLPAYLFILAQSLPGALPHYQPSRTAEART